MSLKARTNRHSRDPTDATHRDEAPMTGPTRDQILQLFAEGRQPEFVEFATTYLVAEPADAEQRLALVRALTELGLLQRAHKTALGFDAAIQNQPDFQQLLQQLSHPQNNGRADLTHYETRFRSNHALLTQRVSWAQPLADVWQDVVDRYELHVTRAGQFEIFDCQEQRWRPCFGLHTPNETNESIRRTVENRVITPIIIEGIALGQHVPLYVNATRHTVHTSSPYIFVVETNLHAWVLALALGDWSQVLDEERVVFCGGESAYAQLDEAIAARPSAPIPSSVIRPPNWQPLPQDGGAQARVTQLKAENEARVKDNRAAAEAKYESRDRRYWAQRFQQALRGDGSPLRVLAVTSRFTTVLKYATRDALRALESAGCQTRLFIEPDDHSYVAPTEVLKSFVEYDPDLLLLIDHTRATQAVWAIENIPVLSWVQDRLPWLFDRSAGLALGELDFLMGHSKRELTEQFGYAAERFYSCNMATDVALLTDESELENPERYDCEVAFASHASETPETFTQSRLIACDNDATRSYVTNIAAELTRRFDAGVLNGAINFQQLLATVAQLTGITLRDDIGATLIAEFARPLTERLIRQQTMRWAATWADTAGARFNVYGRGWEQHPEFARFAKGEIPHGPALGAAFRRAKVNLHAGCNHALHQRVLDGLAAGGFFLLRRHAADSASGLARAVVNHVHEHGLTPPAEFLGTDMSQPWGTIYQHICRDKGTDPSEPLQLNERNWARLNRIALACEEKAPDQLWPELNEVTFGSKAEFVERLEWFMTEPDRRRTVVESIRKPVLKYFSYDALMNKTLSWMLDALSSSGERVRATSPMLSEANA